MADHEHTTQSSSYSLRGVRWRVNFKGKDATWKCAYNMPAILSFQLPVGFSTALTWSCAATGTHDDQDPTLLAIDKEAGACLASDCSSVVRGIVCLAILET